MSVQRIFLNIESAMFSEHHHHDRNVLFIVHSSLLYCLGLYMVSLYFFVVFYLALLADDSTDLDPRQPPVAYA